MGVRPARLPTFLSRVDREGLQLGGARGTSPGGESPPPFLVLSLLRICAIRCAVRCPFFRDPLSLDLLLFAWYSPPAKNRGPPSSLDILPPSEPPSGAAKPPPPAHDPGSRAEIPRGFSGVILGPDLLSWRVRPSPPRPRAFPHLGGRGAPSGVPVVAVPGRVPRVLVSLPGAVVSCPGGASGVFGLGARLSVGVVAKARNCLPLLSFGPRARRVGAVPVVSRSRFLGARGGEQQSFGRNLPP